MRHLLRIFLVAGIAATFAVQTLAAAGKPSSKRQAAEAWTQDGLQKREIKGLDVVYVRPSASLAGYQKILLKPVDISFRRDWGRSAPGIAGTRVRAIDAQRIRDKLAKLMREEAAKQLTQGGYALVEASGDDVLEVDAAITDLYLVAPDVQGAEGVRVFAVSAGEMTLVAELRDSASGEVIARTYDHAYARETARPHRITNSENTVEARRVAGEWAKQLRLQLDLARKGAPPKP